MKKFDPLMEPATLEALDRISKGDSSPTDGHAIHLLCQISQTISLKRIADVLEKFLELARTKA